MRLYSTISCDGVRNRWHSVLHRGRVFRGIQSVVIADKAPRSAGGGIESVRTEKNALPSAQSATAVASTAQYRAVSTRLDGNAALY